MTGRPAHVGTRAGSGGASVAARRAAGPPRPRTPSMDADRVAAADQVVSDPDWRCRAACAGQDTEQWFTDNHSVQDKRTTLDAQAVCLGCPVRGDCLSWALALKVTYGVYGGLTADERRKLKKAKR